MAALACAAWRLARRGPTAGRRLFLVEHSLKTTPALRLSCLTAAVALGCGPITPRPDGGGREDGGADAGRDAGYDAGTADAGLPVGQACTLLNARRCEYLRQCGLIGADDPSRRDCLAWLLATWCGPSLWPARVNPLINTLRYDGVQALACAESFPGRACAEYESLPVACSRFLAPNAYTREACYDGYQECTEGVCRGAACPRSCQPRGAAGEVCRLSGDCRAGLYCKVTNTAAGIGLCTALGVDGSACDSAQPCGPNLTCISGLCRFPPTEGSPCPALVCDSTAWCLATADGGVCAGRRNQGVGCSDDVQCLDELLCDSLRLTCEPRVLAQPGSPCGQRQECPFGNVCVGATATNLGSCAAPLSQGLACGGSSECLPHLACTSASDGGRVCGARLQAGAPCAFDRDCQVLSRCRQGACVELPATGESCDQAQECLWGPCAAQPDAGLMCVERYGPGAVCQLDADCASQKCVSGRCLASCAP